MNINPANSTPFVPQFDNEVNVTESYTEISGTDVARERFTNSGNSNVFQRSNGFNFFENVENASGNVYLGGKDSDNVFIESGDTNRAYTGEGNDIVIDRGVNTTFYTGGGDDVASMSGTNGYAFTGQGNDELFDNGTNNYLLGEGGDDEIRINAEAVNSTVDAGDGNDSLIITGDHTAYMANGDDTVQTSQAWGSVIDGGAGNDTIKLDVTVNPFFTRFETTPGKNEVTISTNIEGTDGPREPLVLTNFERIEWSDGSVSTYESDTGEWSTDLVLQPGND